MECKYHPKKEASSICIICKTPLCDDCDFEIQGKAYCKKCATKLIEDIDSKLKLEIPEEVKCYICGEERTYGLNYYVCNNCGNVVCPSHYNSNYSVCIKCYQNIIEKEIEEKKKFGKTWICSYCNTHNLLDHDKCRKCGKLSPEMEKILKIKKEKKKKLTKSIFIGLGGLIGFIIFMSIIYGIISTINEHMNKSEIYNRAESYLYDRKYEEAISNFIALGDYKDSKKRVEEARREAGKYYINLAQLAEKEGKYKEAIKNYETAGKYKHTKDDIRKLSLLLANKYYEAEEYEDAINYFERANAISSLKNDDLEKYNISKVMIKLKTLSDMFEEGVRYYKDGDFLEALNTFDYIEKELFNIKNIVVNTDKETIVSSLINKNKKMLKNTKNRLSNIIIGVWSGETGMANEEINFLGNGVCIIKTDEYVNTGLYTFDGKFLEIKYDIYFGKDKDSVIYQGYIDYVGNDWVLSGDLHYYTIDNKVMEFEFKWKKMK